MENNPFYYHKQLLPTIPSEQILQIYPNVTLQLKEIKIIDLSLKITSHRLLLQSTSNHMFVVDASKITNVYQSESGFFSKEYSLKIITSVTQDKLKLIFNHYKEACVVIQAMLKKMAWNQQPIITKKMQQKQQNIHIKQSKVQQSFESFNSLFGNIKQLKDMMMEMQGTGKTDQNPQLQKILKDIGFIQVANKEDLGTNYLNHVANDLYQICHKTLFSTFGGIVPLLDLFYFYNSKRKMQLVSPQELLQACQLFQSLGFKAKLVNYPNNIKIIQSTSFNALQDFKNNYEQFFTTFKAGYTAEQISKAKGLPVAIIQIKLQCALKIGLLALDDRIEGLKYYKNMFITI